MNQLSHDLVAKTRKIEALVLRVFAERLEEQLAHNEKAHAATWAFPSETYANVYIPEDKDCIVNDLNQKSKQRKWVCDVLLPTSY